MSYDYATPGFFKNIRFLRLEGEKCESILPVWKGGWEKFQESTNLVIKQRKLSVLLVAIVGLWVVSMLLPFPNMVRATTVITDNFNDMDFAGWDTYGHILNWTTAPPKASLAGSANFSAADQTLKVTGPEGNFTYSNWNNAYIASTVSFGIWSFDMYVVNTTQGYGFVNLMADHYYPVEMYSAIPGPYMNNSFEIWCYTRNLTAHNIPFDRPTISLERWVNGFGTLRGQYAVGSPSDTWNNCWVHFDVIRNTTGHIMVFVNGTLRISTLDSLSSIPGYFKFTGQSGWAIDSVVISGTADVPDTTNGDGDGLDLTLPLIAIVAIELIVIIVLIILYLRRRS